MPNSVGRNPEPSRGCKVTSVKVFLLSIWEKAYTEAGAKLGAEFALICRFPEAEYDGCYVSAVMNL